MGKRKIYISDPVLSLCEYVDEIDDLKGYECWLDEGTEQGFNYRTSCTFEEFAVQPVRSRFLATIFRRSDGVDIGQIFVSPESELPDLAIMMYKQYRGLGYGPRAFMLGIRYCFEVLGLDRVYAGCYEQNIASEKMLWKCGFECHLAGDRNEKHYLTGEDIVQRDYVLRQC